jgi:hypothetical protein
VFFKTQMTFPPDYSRSPGKQELPTFKTQMTSPPDYSRSPGKQELSTFKTQMTSPPIPASLVTYCNPGEKSSVF